MKFTLQTGETNEILRKRADDVTLAELSQVAKTGKEMLTWLRKKDNGAGLAAPQIGLSKRMVVVNLYEEHDDELHLIKSLLMINPVITEKSDEVELDEEGCFSCPGEYGKVLRASRITVEFRDEKFALKRLKLTGFSARVVQHEIDHLDGILFTDKVQGSILIEKEVKRSIKKDAPNV